MCGRRALRNCSDIMVLKLGHFAKQIRNTGNVSKCVLKKDGEDRLDRSCEE
jgi:hypothetical protein